MAAGRLPKKRGARPRLNPSKSLTESTYEILREDILSSRLRPGERLKVNVLCKKVGVSPGAVREALARLVSDGLVISTSWRGCRVATMCLEELEDVLGARIEMETVCLRRSIQKGDIGWETRLVAADHLLSRLTEQLGPEEMFTSERWAEAHADFHLALAEACGSEWLLRLRAIVYTQTERYRRLSLTPRPGRDLASEHRAIARAAIARDAETACRLLTEHLLLSRYTYLRGLRTDGVSEASDAEDLKSIHKRKTARAAR